MKFKIKDPKNNDTCVVKVTTQTEVKPPDSGNLSLPVTNHLLAVQVVNQLVQEVDYSHS